MLAGKHTTGRAKSLGQTPNTRWGREVHLQTSYFSDILYICCIIMTHTGPAVAATHPCGRAGTFFILCFLGFIGDCRNSSLILRR